MILLAILPQDLRSAASPTFADLTLSAPVNIYSLSHDSFADFVANEHIDWTAAASAFSTTGTLTSGNLTIGSGAVGVDYTLAFNGETNDFLATWMEDEDYLLLADDIKLAGGENIILDTVTGTQIGTATSQLLGFYGATPVDRPATVSDAATQDLTGTDTVDKTKLSSDLTGIVAAINAVIDRLQELGLMA